MCVYQDAVDLAMGLKATLMHSTILIYRLFSAFTNVYSFTKLVTYEIIKYLSDKNTLATTNHQRVSDCFLKIDIALQKIGP